MTDKATVEIPSPVDGEVLWLGAEIGQTVAVGSPIVRLKVAGEGNAAAATAAPATAESPKPAALKEAAATAEKPVAKAPEPAPKAAPATPQKVAARPAASAG